MTEKELHDIERRSEMIVKGYAFLSRDDGLIGILNLYHPESAMVINKDCEMIETNMDDIEQQIVINLCLRNLRFMEA